MFSEDGANEQIVTPGDRNHIQHYLAGHKRSVKVYIYLNVPYADVFLEDKAGFDLIYNRIVNDLIMWTPFLPTLPVQVPDFVVQQKIDMDMTNPFDSILLADTRANDALLGSTHTLTQECLNEFEQPPPSLSPLTSTFYSCVPSEGKNRMDKSCDSNASDASYHSFVNSTIGGNADAGKSSFVHTNIVQNVEDDDQGDEDLPNEFMLELEVNNLKISFKTSAGRKNSVFLSDLLLGIVVGPDVKPSTVLAICSDNVMFHSDDRPILVGNSFLESNPVLANSFPRPSPSASATPMSSLNLSIDIRRQSGASDLKKIKLAVQLRKSLLLGLDLPIFEDVFDFVQLKDDDILGYVCPKVIVELHVDIVQCGVSFEQIQERPTLLHCEDVYLTSMVVENTDQTVLRFFIEEALLCFKRNNLCPEVLRNYIAVIDSGIIDISLKLSKDGRLELKVSNNEINVKACADSLAALCTFLQAFAVSMTGTGASASFSNASSDSDYTSSESTVMSAASEQQSEDKAPSSSSKSNVAEKKMVVNTNLIAEALEECSLSLTNEQSSPKSFVDSDEEEEEGKSNTEDNSETDKSRSNSFMNNPNSLDESTFWVLGDDDYGSGINLTRDPVVRSLTTDTIEVVDNHFKTANYNMIPEMSQIATLTRYLLEKMTLKVSLFGGTDFDDVPKNSSTEKSSECDEDRKSVSTTRSSRQPSNKGKLDGTSQMNFSTRPKPSQNVRFQNTSSSVIWENIDLVSTTGYSINSTTTAMSAATALGSNTKDTGSGGANFMAQESQYSSIKHLGGSKRKSDVCVVLVLNKIKILFDHFEPTSEMAWRFLLFIQEIEIEDRVNASKIKKILYEYYSESIPRRKYSNMFSVRLTCKRNFDDQNEECDLRVSLKALRVNIDQDTLLFLMDFFILLNEILLPPKTQDDQRMELESNNSKKQRFSNGNRSRLNSDDDMDQYGNGQSPNSDFGSEDNVCMEKRPKVGSTPTSSSSSDLFIKSFVFSPDVPIRLDYHGKHIDLKKVTLLWKSFY